MFRTNVEFLRKPYESGIQRVIFGDFMKQILDWNHYLDVSRRAVAEGLVLLENRGNALPFTKGMKVSIFGRIQNHYYKSGTGSGGLVNVSHVTGIPEGLCESGVVTVNEELAKIYEDWEKENPFDVGVGWGMEPWSQKEMPLGDEVSAGEVGDVVGKEDSPADSQATGTSAIAARAAKISDAALVIIGRTAGEEKDASKTKGSYYLTDTENEMLRLVRKYFKRMVVVLNVGGLIDLSFVDDVKPDAVLFGWQGGMVGGHGTADVLCGKVNPSGKLVDTVAYNVDDYPSDANFGDPVRNEYKEGVFVGYRYFETKAKDKVRYPFGYGLSYTDFEVSAGDLVCKTRKDEDVPNSLSNGEKRPFDYAQGDSGFSKVEITCTVKNVGAVSGKQVVQVYASAPKGKLEKPEKVLVAFAKTKELNQNESEEIKLAFGFDRFASYDESGVSGHKSAWILEGGEYKFFVGENVRDTELIGSVDIAETVLETLEPVFDGSEREIVLPEEIPFTGRTGIKLEDVYNAMNGAAPNAISADQTPSPKTACASGESVSQTELPLRNFVAQLTDTELSQIIRGEGMGSSLVTPGTASAFGGVSESLRELGVVPCCCDDGPSGMRLDCGTKAFSLPNGTLLACTFNQELNEELFTLLGLEMVHNKVDCLLGPGINIHRHPLNGRNFEYFSEDPLVTGLIAVAQLKGMKKFGAGGTLKHFAGNNQELKRHSVDSAIGERALREIYLKAFEIAVKSGYCDSIMTSYGKVNGTYAASNYDLCTTILRGDWGYTGIVMTDWWASITTDDKGIPHARDFDKLVRSQNDLYMVCPSGEENKTGDNTLESLKNGNLTRAELQRAAMNICRYVLHTPAFLRSIGKCVQVEIINRPKENDDVIPDDVQYRKLDGEITIDLSGETCDIGSNYVLALDVVRIGKYRMTLSASSELSELAQMTCTLLMGFPIVSMTFHGTKGRVESISREIPIFGRFAIFRLVVGAKGLKLHDIKFELVEEFKSKDRVWK